MSQRSTRWRGLTGLVALLALLLAACGSSGGTSDAGGGDSAKTTTTAAKATAAGSPKIVASTSWVGAIAKLAGADDITVIAPSNIQHPPDYEPTASDLAALADADFVLLAGFEGFADRLKEASGSDAKVIEVATDYKPAAIHEQVHELAAAFGTDDEAEKRFEAYEAEYEQASKDLQAITADAPQTIVAQAFVAGWAEFAGYEVAGTYGPEPTSASQVADLAGKKPTLIFENVHMGGGDEVAEAAGVDKVDLVNFPGDDLELMPVVEANVGLITKAIEG